MKTRNLCGGAIVPYFILVLLIHFFINTCAETSSPTILKSYPKPEVSAEYLVQSDKIFLDSYGEEKVRSEALGLLKERCENSSLNDPHACYNLSVLLNQAGQKSEAIVYIEKAVSKSPNDPLYYSMYRNLSVQLEKVDSQNTDEFTKEFSKLELACAKKDESKAASLIEPLLVSGAISRSLLQNGSLSECFSNPQKERLMKIAKNSSINYSEAYYKQKESSDPYSSFWDVGYMVRKQKLEDYDGKQKLSSIWKEFRKAVKSNDGVKAKSTLTEFLAEVRSPETKKKVDSTKLLSLERAAYLLIEQDKFFATQKHLLKEF